MSEFRMDPNWLPFDPNPSKPTYTPPPGAVDAHCHVFGPGSLFPYAPERKYTPCDASAAQLFSLRNLLGFERNVIVQATCHGTDNRAMLDAIARSGDTARGVATVSPHIADAELRALDAAGVRGVRFNFVRRLVDTPDPEELRRIAHRVAELGWHIVIYFEAQDLPELYDFFVSLPTTLVVDHMGRPDLCKPVDGAEFQLFVRMMREHPNIWSKVTCPERLSTIGPPNYPDFVPFARQLVESFPDRVLWGTDWPHPNLRSHMPDDGHLVDIIPKIAVTEDFRSRLLVDNPTKLYWSR